MLPGIPGSELTNSTYYIPRPVRGRPVYGSYVYYDRALTAHRSFAPTHVYHAAYTNLTGTSDTSRD